jgi:hypothetical protein
VNLIPNPEQTARFEGMTADADTLRALGRSHAVLLDNNRHVVTVFDYEPAIDYRPTTEGETACP